MQGWRQWQEVTGDRVPSEGTGPIEEEFEHRLETAECSTGWAEALSG